MGANLHKFSEELDFHCPKEKMFLPLKKTNKKEFNLDLTYKRFAFLKSMEKHKKEQEEYESYLRKSAVIVDVNVDVDVNVSDDNLLIVDEQSDDDNNDDDDKDAHD